jgi:hypothetical protein
VSLQLSVRYVYVEMIKSLRTKVILSFAGYL